MNHYGKIFINKHFSFDKSEELTWRNAWIDETLRPTITTQTLLSSILDKLPWEPTLQPILIDLLKKDFRNRLLSNPYIVVEGGEKIKCINPRKWVMVYKSPFIIGVNFVEHHV